MPQSGAILAPGAFRLLLALLVFVSHATRFNVGVLGVMLFFLLSGYWVTSILRAKFAGHSVWWFYASRFFRIMPLYLLVAVPAAILLAKPLLPNILLFGLASNKPADALTISWSLDIELQFYLLLPFAIALLGRISLLAVLATVPIAAAAWWLHYETVWATVLQYLPAFALGAYLHDNPYRPSVRTAHVSLAAFLGLTIILALIPATSAFLFKTTEIPVGTEIFSMLWMLPLIPYVAYSLTIPSDKFDRHLGNLSYPFYLLHSLALFAVGMFAEGMAVKVIALLATSVLSVVLYVAVDRPVERWRHRFLTPRS